MSSKEVDIFRADKKKWYTVDSDGNKYWIKSLVDEFWKQLIENKINHNDFNFQGYIFPSFSSDTNMKLDLARNYLKNHLANPQNPKMNSFLGKVNTAIVKERVDFLGCVFLGHFHIQHFIFEGPVYFRDCVFDDEARFQENTFKNHFGLRKCTFRGETFFLDSNFLMGYYIGDNSSFANSFTLLSGYFGGNFSISQCNFDDRAHISRAKFSSRADIQLTSFKKDFDFFQNDFFQGLFLVELSFYRNLSIQDIKMKNGTFQKLNFVGTSYLFENITLLENTVLNFNNCNFNKDVIFKDCNIQNFKFGLSNISSVKFLSCNWKIRARLFLRDEEGANIKNITTLQHLEDKYRQLKSNFEGIKDWELAGLAYVSEMKMREKRLFIEKDYMSYFIYKIYDAFGGYTQNFKRPLYIFLLLTFIIFPLYYTIFESCDTIINFNNCFLIGLSEGYQKSLSASFPLVSSDLFYDNWWVKSLQSFFSLLLITFFVLALRKRFKQ